MPSTSFSLDGEMIRSTCRGATHNRVVVILSLEVQIDGWGGLAEDVQQVELPDSILFDCVRVYQRDAS